MLTRFFRKLRLFFWFYVLRPVRKVINLVFRGRVVEDNERNRQIMDFCMKIIKDPGYEASNPVEHWTEREWRQLFDEVVKEVNASEEMTEAERDGLMEFKNFRMVIAHQVAKELMESVFIKAA